jgi:hypothetical protein
VGDFVRAANKVGGGQVYKVLDKPTNTSVQLHCADGYEDIADGDTLEEVTATGVYTCVLNLDSGDLPSPENPYGVIAVDATTVIAGDGPVFERKYALSWTRTVELELGRQFVVR